MIQLRPNLNRLLYAFFGRPKEETKDDNRCTLTFKSSLLAGAVFDRFRLSTSASYTWVKKKHGWEGAPRRVSTGSTFPSISVSIKSDLVTITYDKN